MTLKDVSEHPEWCSIAGFTDAVCMADVLPALIVIFTHESHLFDNLSCEERKHSNSVFIESNLACSVINNHSRFWFRVLIEEVSVV